MVAGVFWFYRIKTESYPSTFQHPFCFHPFIGFISINSDWRRIGVITGGYSIVQQFFHVSLLWQFYLNNCVLPVSMRSLKFFPVSPAIGFSGMVESIGFGADGFFVIQGHPFARVAE